MIRLFSVLLFIPAISLPGISQIVINEVASASTIGFVDEDGDQEDWIEFYNTTGTAINMQGYTISIVENAKTKTWTFPNIYIKPYGYLTVFCSEKNRTAWFDHWEVPVYANNPWKYFVGTSNPPSNWRDVNFNDTPWATGPGGIGYGDGDDSTIIPVCNSVFMRKSFTIADTSKIATCALLLDLDDGFVAYLNDVEIGRFNLGAYGDHPIYNVSAYDEHEAQMYQNGNFTAGFFISPDLVDSAIRPGNNVLAIQTHNYVSGMDDLSCIAYFLLGVSDTTVTYFPFPADIHLHTSFNLNSSGQLMTLKDASGNVLDQQSIGPMQMDHSRGRKPDGSSAWCLFNAATPDTSNNTSTCYSGYANTPVISLNAGFYSGTQTVSITSTTPGTIRWTNDGNDPDLFSSIYSGPISIDSNQVLRARVFPSNISTLPSLITTNTYFINESITLPVVSLTSDPYNLFDWYYGIYVLGPYADTVNIPYQGANFWQGWERPANIEYFDGQNKFQFEISSGIKIQGNFSKAWPQRGFTVKAKDNYGGSKINYVLFPDKPFITSYKSFNIRNAGSDWNTCHMRDRFNQKSVQNKTDIDMMDGRPCVLFINGQYWGVYELRERQDENYIEDNSGVNKNYIDYLQFDGDIIAGSNKPFFDMVGFITTNSMAVEQNYDSAKQMLDIDNFCDYFITETYIVNTDWLGAYTNNIKFWRPNSPPGKWRYVLWDTDLSMGFLPSWGGDFTTDFLDVAINPSTWNPHSGMLNSLLQNPEFKNYFVNRYADLMNTIFHPLNVRNRAYGFRDEMLPEMTRHFNLWGGTSPWPAAIGRSYDVPSWFVNIDSLCYFSDNRIVYARNYIQAQFNLVKQVDVTLDTYPAGAGEIKISTIIPDSFPWTGVYFDGVPVTMTAIPKPGYKFIYWRSNSVIQGENKNGSITYNIDTNDVFTAYFEPLENYFAAFPNPFSNTLTIVYELPDQQQAELAIYNLLGQKVEVLVPFTTFQNAGVHTLILDPVALGLSNGVYILEFKTAGYRQTIKLVHAKE